MKIFSLALVILGLSLTGCNTEPPKSTETVVTQASPTPTSTPTESTPATPKPSFVGMIRNVSVYPVPNNSKDVALTLVLSVHNSGAPSLIRSWTLEVDSPEQTLPSGLQAVHISGTVDLPGAGGGKVDLDKEDLAQKTSKTPVPTGKQMAGVLTFVLPNTTEKQLSNTKTSIILHFKDTEGNGYRTSKTMVGANVKNQKAN